ncbi:MAG: L,D-transpeptidase [Polyangiaceae bacterium]
MPELPKEQDSEAEPSCLGGLAENFVWIRAVDDDPDVMRRIFMACTLMACACQRKAPAPSDAPPPSLSTTERPTAILYPPPEAPRPRVGVLAPRVYVRQRPSAGSMEIGTLYLSAVVELKSPKPAGHDGCPGGWLSVQPEGYVCQDASVTTAPDQSALFAALSRYGGDYSQPVPHRWVASRQAPVYRHVPTTREQQRTEGGYLKDLAAAREGQRRRAFANADLTLPSAPLPEFLKNGAWSPFSTQHGEPELPLREWIPARSTVAVVAEVTVDARSYYLTQDLGLVPRDRVDLLNPSVFRGLTEEQGLRLPLAFVRYDETPSYRRVDEPQVQPASIGAGPGDGEIHGRVEATGQHFKRLSWVGLTGRVLLRGSRRYLETRHDGLFIEDDQRAAVIQAEPPRGFELAAGEKWIDVSIHRGTLVAYEGRRAVFATLISPGVAGYKRTDDGAFAKHATPTGTFRMEWKHQSTTMSPDPKRKSYYLSEVPWTQFFHMPFALHAAYWHDRFGEPKSGGCVNLSPKDAKWLFDWTEPHLPDGWHGVRSGGARGAGTWVRVR